MVSGESFQVNALRGTTTPATGRRRFNDTSDSSAAADVAFLTPRWWISSSYLTYRVL